MAITINGTTGISGVDGSAGTPAIQGTDNNTGVFYPSADTVGIATNGTTAVTISAAQVVTLANALPVASGGTGSTTNAGASFALKGANSDITSLSGLTTPLSLAQGGTGQTTAALAGAALGAVGVGQTWSNLTASRASGTTYTNSTGRPIMVTVCTNMGTNQRIETSVGGVKIVDMGGSTIYGDMGLNVFIVPNSTTYVVTATQGTIQIWAELR
jgi:hypothetical protein